MQTLLKVAVLATALFSVFPQAVRAHETVSVPETSQRASEIILTIHGAPNTEGGKALTFDRDSLRTIDDHQFTTSTIWTDGQHVFRGVRLATLLAHLGVETGTIRASALNDYAVEFPVADALRDDALIAYEMDGKEMSVREKGPLWLIHPFDSKKAYQSKTYYLRSVWQLDSLTFKN